MELPAHVITSLSLGQMAMPPLCQAPGLALPFLKALLKGIRQVLAWPALNVSPARQWLGPGTCRELLRGSQKLKDPTLQGPQLRLLCGSPMGSYVPLPCPLSVFRMQDGKLG